MEELKRVKDKLLLIVNTDNNKFIEVITNGRLTVKQIIQFETEIDKFINKLNS